MGGLAVGIPVSALMWYGIAFASSDTVRDTSRTLWRLAEFIPFF